MRTRNKPALIFFCLLLSATAVLSGVNIYSELNEQQKEKDDFAAVAEIVRFIDHHEVIRRPIQLREVRSAGEAAGA